MKAWVIAIVMVVGLWARWPQHATLVYEDDKSQMTATTMTLGPRLLTRWTWATWPDAPAAQVVNLALHVVTTLLLFVLVGQITTDPFVPMAVAFLWWVHPVATEAVAYATGRADVLALIGVLVMCISAASPTWHRPLNLAGLAVGLLFGLAGKETALVGIPLAALCLPRPLTHRRTAGILAGLVVLFGWGVVIYYGGIHNLLMTGAVFNGQVVTVSAVTWARLQMTATARMMALSIDPWLGQTVDYDYPRVDLAWQWLSVYALVMLVAAAVVWRKHWLLSTGIAWTLLASLPRWILQTPESYYNEHQFYVALPGMIMVLVGLLMLVPDLLVNQSVPPV